MQSSSIPAKYLVPFAQNDSAKVEIPVTTADTTRASQSLGFPPRTMLPPEASGVPPQGEDFNGAMNQIARAAWWMLQGNSFPYDSAFATDTNIGGYAKGAWLPRADLTGYWLNTVDNNSTNPDATDGSAANWVPGFNYGSATVAVTTTTTVYPVTAAKSVLTLTGTLTANSVVNLPAWTREWLLINNTTQAGFTLTAKTVSGTGVTLAAGAQRVRGDGTNIVQSPESIAAATLSTQAAQLGQVQIAQLGAATVYTLSTSTTLTSAAIGSHNEITAAVATTLPAASSVGQGRAISFRSTIAGATVLRAGTDTISTGNGAAITSMTLNAGDFATLYSNGSNGWYLVDGSLQAQYASIMRQTTTLAVPGYRAFPAYPGDPTPLIMQWGYTTSPSGANTNTTTTLLTAFPNVNMGVTLTDFATVGNNAVFWTVAALNLNNFTSYWGAGASTPGSTTARSAFYVAWGR